MFSFIFILLLFFLVVPWTHGHCCSSWQLLQMSLPHSGHFSLHDGQTRSPQALHSSRQPRQVVSSHRRQYEVHSSQKSFFARTAPVDVVAAHRVAAVVARPAFPVRQGDVGRVGVVVGQHGRDQLEEVADAAVGQGRLDGRAGVALAHVLIADVRVRDGVVAGGRVGIDGHDPVDRAVPLELGQAADLEPDLELAEVVALQLDGLGRHDQEIAVLDVLEVLELLLGLLEVGQDVADGRQLRLAGLDHPLDLAGVVWQVLQALSDAIGHLLGRGVPVLLRQMASRLLVRRSCSRFSIRLAVRLDHLAEAAALQEPELIVNLLRKAN